MALIPTDRWTWAVVGLAVATAPRNPPTFGHRWHDRIGGIGASVQTISGFGQRTLRAITTGLQINDSYMTMILHEVSY
jgi:hypothetical protein